MPNGPTQRDRVERALRDAGQVGICQVDFYAPHVIDNGKPITRLAARIGELRDAGLQIDSSGTRHGCAVYKLISAPGASDGPVATSVEEEPPDHAAVVGDISPGPSDAPALSFDDLFPPAPRSAINDDWEQAA